MNRVMHVGVIHGARPDGEDAAVLSALEVEAYSESLLKAGYRVWREGEPDQMRLRIESSWLQCEVDESIGTLRNVGVIQGLPVYMDPCDPEIWAIQAYLTVTGTADAVAAQRKRRDCDEQRDDATASRCAGRRVG